MGCDDILFDILRKFSETGEYSESPRLIDLIEYAEFNVYLESPYLDSWKTSGYESEEAWEEDNKEWLDFIDSRADIIEKCKKRIPNLDKLVIKPYDDICDRIEKFLRRKLKEEEKNKNKKTHA